MNANASVHRIRSHLRYLVSQSSVLLGEALESRRPQVVLCTKGGNGVQFGRVVKRFDDKFLDESLSRSLKRFRTDYIDIYLLHNPPVQVLRDGYAFAWLERQREKGLIRHWGLSVYDNVEDARLALAAGARVIEARYNLLRSDLLPGLESELERAVGDGVAGIARPPWDHHVAQKGHPERRTHDDGHEYEGRRLGDQGETEEQSGDRSRPPFLIRIIGRESTLSTAYICWGIPPQYACC